MKRFNLPIWGIVTILAIIGGVLAIFKEKITDYISLSILIGISLFAIVGFVASIFFMNKFDK